MSNASTPDKGSRVVNARVTMRGGIGAKRSKFSKQELSAQHQ